MTGNGSKVEKLSAMIEWEARASAMSVYDDNSWSGDDESIEVDGIPYWHDGLNGLDYLDVGVVTTATHCSLYGRYSEIPLPEMAGSLLVAMIADVGSEQEIELAHLLESVGGLTEDEWLELEHVECIHDRQLAYSGSSTIGGVWLTPSWNGIQKPTDDEVESGIAESLELARSIATDTGAIRYYEAYNSTGDWEFQALAFASLVRESVEEESL